jgi:hypothetical protein
MVAQNVLQPVKIDRKYVQIFSVVSPECSACYCRAGEQYVFSYMCKGSSKWCGMVTCFKQQPVTEFFLEEKDSVTNIHIQLKKCMWCQCCWYRHCYSLGFTNCKFWEQPHGAQWHAVLGLANNSSHSGMAQHGVKMTNWLQPESLKMRS